MAMYSVKVLSLSPFKKLPARVLHYRCAVTGDANRKDRRKERRKKRTKLLYSNWLSSEENTLRALFFFWFITFMFLAKNLE